MKQGSSSRKVNEQAHCKYSAFRDKRSAFKHGDYYVMRG